MISLSGALTRSGCLRYAEKSYRRLLASFASDLFHLSKNCLEFSILSLERIIIYLICSLRIGVTQVQIFIRNLQVQVSVSSRIKIPSGCSLTDVSLIQITFSLFYSILYFSYYLRFFIHMPCCDHSVHAAISNLDCPVDRRELATAAIHNTSVRLSVCLSFCLAMYLSRYIAIMAINHSLNLIFSFFSLNNKFHLEVSSLILCDSHFLIFRSIITPVRISV